MADFVVCTIAGERFEMAREQVERAVAGTLPEPLHEHFVVIGGRRYPPKQVIALVTGLDRADFTTHQARRVLRRLGFPTGRRPAVAAEPQATYEARAMPYGGRQAEALRPHIGKWVAIRGPEVLIAGDSFEEVYRWLEEHGEQADGMFRVPSSEMGASGWTSWSLEP